MSEHGDTRTGKGFSIRSQDTGEPWFQVKTVYGADGEHKTPYMTRVILGRWRLHIFHRGDLDEDPHDHPWSFWTFPLTPYVEKVYERSGEEIVGKHPRYIAVRVVPAWRWSFRPALHTHKVLGRWGGQGSGANASFPWIAPEVDTMIVDEGVPDLEGGRMIPIKWHFEKRPRKIVTIVRRGPEERKWGFLKLRDGKWCWQHWKDYLLQGGKHAPCE